MNNIMNLSVSTGSLGSYIYSVNRVPVLTAQEEEQLVRRFRDQGDIEAARRLVLSHLRFVVKVASGYKGYGLPLADLIQEGNIGLMKAVKRFSPDRGVRLVSFAVYWIRAEIHEFVIRNWRIVKIATTKAQRKLFFNLRSAKKRLGWLNPEEVQLVAKDLGVKPDEVVEMEKRMGNGDISMEMDSAEDGGQSSFSPANYIEDPNQRPDEQIENTQYEQQSKQALLTAIESLDARSRDIIYQRWLGEDKSTLQALAKQYKISLERIRQIEASALKKLRTSMAKSNIG